MSTMLGKLKDFAREQDGPTATEYAFMLAVIIVACLGAITTLSDKVQDTFTLVTSSMPDGTAPG
ncbi:MAG: Flp family type IVb pilin [Phycisphaerales bacterium]|nr:Flp family type IVb pilin [Phycisphaerales bacterium]